MTNLQGGGEPHAKVKGQARPKSYERRLSGYHFKNRSNIRFQPEPGLSYRRLLGLILFHHITFFDITYWMHLCQ